MLRMLTDIQAEACIDILHWSPINPGSSEALAPATRVAGLPWRSDPPPHASQAPGASNSQT
eukprot:1153050-Pelagomonas_calceolata.AAC.17